MAGKPENNPVNMQTATNAADEERLRKIEIGYHLAEGAFNLASSELTTFLREHVGIVPSMTQTPRGILTRVNALRLRHPELRRLETRQRETKQTRDKLLAERAELLQACGHIR